MSTKKKAPRKNWKNYQEYLKSPEWAIIKAEVKKRDSSTCQLCADEENIHCHHWRYPKDWNDDSLDNVLVVCEKCHTRAHIWLDFDDNNYESKYEFIAEFLQTFVQEFSYDGLLLTFAEVVYESKLKVVKVVYPRGSYLIGNNHYFSKRDGEFIIGYLKSKGETVND